VFLAFSENSKRIGKRHLPDNLRLRRCDDPVFGIQHVRQPQLRDGKNIGVERLSDELAAHLCAGEINAGRFVADKVGDRGFGPETFRFRIFSFHGNSIRWRYQIGCNGIITK